MPHRGDVMGPQESTPEPAHLTVTEHHTMHPLNPHGDLALFELERHRLVQEIARARRAPHTRSLAARLWARIAHPLHRDA